MASEPLRNLGQVLAVIPSRLDGARQQVKAAAEPMVEAAVGKAMEVAARAGIVSDCGMLDTFAGMSGDKLKFTFESNRMQSAHRALMEMLEKLGRI